MPNLPSEIRQRRTPDQIAKICQAMYDILAEDHPMTVRHVFYRLISKGLIRKSESEYRGVVVRLLTRMRETGKVSFRWISDNTRWMMKPTTYGSLDSWLSINTQAYRRSLWVSQPAYVEIWCEKDAIGGFLYEETASYDVPLMVNRGMPSLTWLHSAAEVIAAQDKPVYIYFFGDHDTAGYDISRNTEKRLREFAVKYNPHVEIHFERVAVTEEQIGEWDLPTRPGKKQRIVDPARRKIEDAVEVDAIEPRRLRELVRDCIERHVDRYELERIKQIEQEERQTLEQWRKEVSPSQEE